jgi:hypothetical protein
MYTNYLALVLGMIISPILLWISKQLKIYIETSLKNRKRQKEFESKMYCIRIINLMNFFEKKMNFFIISDIYNYEI